LGKFEVAAARSFQRGRLPEVVILYIEPRYCYSAAKWGVEGFSEVLSREVASLCIKVTIVEPGGFRTDFAGSSTELSEGHPEYDSTVGATRKISAELQRQAAW
jgi:NAD(P)-dependent dehydrogenase (short-subunit alcohol dehydrogenase family)